VRYRGQAFELTVSAPIDATTALLRERFEAAHAERYGYAGDRDEVELVNVRVAAVADRPAEALQAAAPAGPVERGHRRARFAGGVLETAVVRGEPELGERFDGPAVMELPETTVVVPPGWRAERDASGAFTMERA
jgi:N-methylhydantoinase A